MLEKRTKRGEAGWIAEEVFEDTALNLHSKCLVIDDQIARGVLDLEQALEIYEVSDADYLDYVIKQQQTQAETRFHGMSARFQTLFHLKYVNSYFKFFTSTIHNSVLVVQISNNINKLEDDVEHGRVKVPNE